MATQLQNQSDDYLRALPPMVSLDQSNQALSISRNHGYRLVKRGEYPLPVHRVGNAYRISRSDLLRFLGVEGAELVSRGAA